MLDAAAAAIAMQSLQCLSHIFSWIPLHTAATNTPASLLTKVFHFATLCDGQAAVAEAAICCVNELIGKNQVPSSSCEEFVLGLFNNVFSLLKSVLHQPQDANEQHLVLARFDQLPNSYVDRLTEFLRLYVTIHLPRFERSAQFPVIDFLAVMFRYTFQQTTNDGFYNCLHIWSEFLDYLHNQMDSRISDKQSCLTKYAADVPLCCIN